MHIFKIKALLYIKPYVFTVFLLLATAGLHNSFAQQPGSKEYVSDYLGTQIKFNAQEIVETIISLRHPSTKLSPSHLGHPGYDNLAFVYDSAVNALILKAAGRQQEAEEIIDYFASRLRLPREEVRRYCDTNRVYGILKVIGPRSGTNYSAVSFVNALDVTSGRRQGRACLEFWTTPGPTSFLIFAMLQVNRAKYSAEAEMLGEALLAMQDAQGGIRDGDRGVEKIHTEPHMDAFCAFLMLYHTTGDARWLQAADKAYSWFIKNVYHPESATIDQGIWRAKANAIFATDVYSWTMAGPAGDRLNLEALGRLTETMLSKGLVRINLELPDTGRRTVVLCDFSNAEDTRIKDVRGGFHPMGSVEWTAGVILSLQKNAVRFYRGGDSKTAGFYKAVAETLFRETMKCFYELGKTRGKITFYSTAQGVEVGPFGTAGNEPSHGWNTPFFYVKADNGQVLLKGGSLVGAWPLLPYFGLNPLIFDDKYKSIYDRIVVTPSAKAEAEAYIRRASAGRSFEEKIPGKAPSVDSQIVEPELFNRKIWEALEQAYAQKRLKNYGKAQIHFNQVIFWAQKIVENPAWVELARSDNLIKQREVGGIISYPWGKTCPDNDCYLHYVILHYPLLNEVGTAMWAQAAANFELGRYAETKYWIGRIIEEVPLHQIADVGQARGSQPKLIQGYWNALVSWEDNPGGHERDEKMHSLYLEVLKEKNLTSAKPKTVVIRQDNPR